MKKTKNNENPLLKVKRNILDKSGFLYILWGLFLLFLILGFIDFKNLFPNTYFLRFISQADFINNPADLILFGTFLVIVIYALETYRLRDETYRLAEATIETKREIKMANQIAIQAGLTLRYQFGKFDGSLDPKWVLLLSNIGKASAIRIRIEPENKEFEIRPRGLNAIKDGDYETVDLYYKGEKQDLGGSIAAYLIGHPLRATIYFERTKPFKKPLSTVVEIGGRPKVSIIETNLSL